LLHRFRQRISGLFHSTDSGKAGCGCNSGPSIPQPLPVYHQPPLDNHHTTPIYNTEPPLANPPAVQPVQPDKTVPVVEQLSFKNPGQSRLALPLNKKFAEKVGHETDYGWITGQLSE